MPVRPANAELRPREYLTPAEIEKLTKAARDGLYGQRDAALILIAYRHGLRAVEVCDLEWSQVNRLIKCIGERAGFPFQVHAHMLRHARATRWRMPATTHGASRIGLVIARFNSTRSGTAS